MPQKYGTLNPRYDRGPVLSRVNFGSFGDSGRWSDKPVVVPVAVAGIGGGAGSFYRHAENSSANRCEYSARPCESPPQAVLSNSRELEREIHS